MAMILFFVLNGAGVVFLLYVLANFWSEGHPPQNDANVQATEFWRRNRDEEIIVTHSISHTGKGNLHVIPFPVRDRGLADKSARRTISRGTVGSPVRRTFTR
jgi:hypothetical protein